MDLKDRQIIRELQKDGRITNQELAERVNLSPSPCLRRLRLLEEAGVIRGYTALVDQKAYGLPITVFLRIRLDRHGEPVIKVFEQAIGRIDEVLDCFLLAGGDDYLLRVIVASLEAYEDFMRRKIHAIPGIASIDTSFAYGVVKQTRVFPV
ncbi:Lrp/AsnC family transcriptional regulator [Caulobacter sp. B11]|uniref:Lrp/AsnC family transcriptional regulator n=1 Tax=Caulobacter sp. B11 TaxID=2048899 RepID=UPI000C129D60|nr:Lrp/AsnC family transcriptional regulator [Caulobacter sp. B11]